jgi:alpha-galactosidase
MSAPLAEVGPTSGVDVAGRSLGDRGFWVPRRPPETVTLVRLIRV